MHVTETYYSYRKILPLTHETIIFLPNECVFNFDQTIYLIHLFFTNFATFSIKLEYQKIDKVEWLKWSRIKLTSMVLF